MYAVERKTRFLIGASTATSLVNAQNRRLTAMQASHPVISGTARLLEREGWRTKTAVYLQLSVLTQAFVDDFGLDWIIVIISPIICDLSQYFDASKGSCVGCPVLMRPNKCVHAPHRRRFPRTGMRGRRRACFKTLTSARGAFDRNYS